MVTVDIRATVEVFVVRLVAVLVLILQCRLSPRVTLLKKTMKAVTGLSRPCCVHGQHTILSIGGGAVWLVVYALPAAPQHLPTGLDRVDPHCS